MPDLIEDPSEKPIRWFAGTPGAPYRPSNGTEGMCFIEAWCSECARDGEMNGTRRQEDCEEGDGRCEILGRSFRSDEPLPEWVYGEDGQPKCTQFVPMGQPIPPPRDTLTIDMFEEKTMTPEEIEAIQLYEEATRAIHVEELADAEGKTPGVLRIWPSQLVRLIRLARANADING